MQRRPATLPVHAHVCVYVHAYVHLHGSTLHADCLPLRHQWTERRRAFERHDRTPAFALAAALAFAFAFAAAFVAAVVFATALAVAL